MDLEYNVLQMKNLGVRDQRYDVRCWHHWADLSQHLQVIRAFAFSCVAISACVFLLVAAIISRTQLIE